MYNTDRALTGFSMQTFSHKKPATSCLMHTVRGVPTCTLQVLSFQNVSLVLHRRNLSKGTLFSKINKGGGSVVDSLMIVIPVFGILIVVGFCCTLFYVHSSFAIILMGKRELVALLGVSFLMSRDGCVALPRGAMGLSSVCNCGIF